jgi:hypothetical protein
MIRNLLAAGALALAISPALAQEGADPHDHIRLPYLKYPEDVPIRRLRSHPERIEDIEFSKDTGRPTLQRAPLGARIRRLALLRL